MVIVNTLSLTLGKVVLQPGVQPLLPLLTLHLYLSLLSLSLFLFGIIGPFSLPVSLFSSSYLSSISIILTQFSSTLLIFSFIFLPVSCPHLSLSHRMFKSQWTGYKNINIWKEEHNTLLFQAHWPCSHILRTTSFSIVWFRQHPAVTLLSCINPVVTGQ